MSRANELARWPDAKRPDALFAAQDRLRLRRAATEEGLASRLSEQIPQIEVCGAATGYPRGRGSGRRRFACRGVGRGRRVSSIKREVAQQQGEQGRFIFEIAAARRVIAERRLQIAQAEDEFQIEVLQELQAVGQKIAREQSLSM
jgi:hypothetical protein